MKMAAILDSPLDILSVMRKLVTFFSVFIRGSCTIFNNARSAEEYKIAKYSFLVDRFHFVPVAIETSGVLGPQSLRFQKEIGHKVALETHELRELESFFQRISLAVIRGNALSVLSARRCSEGS